MTYSTSTILPLLSQRRLRTMYPARSGSFRADPMLSVPSLADFRQASSGVVPVLRQVQHHGEQPFGFQRQPCVAQVVVGHYRVVAGFLNAKYRHVITYFWRSKKCLFSGKRRPLCHLDTTEGQTYGRSPSG